MTFPVFLDTCVRYPATLCDTLLRIAERGVYRPPWSEGVLGELTRNLAKIPTVGDLGAIRRIDFMRGAFEDAMLTGYDELAPGLTCDRKDAHVLAAAIVSECQVIVTFNTKDFPPESVATHDLEVVHPDDFLLDQLDLYPSIVLNVLKSQSESSTRPSLTLPGLITSPGHGGLPKFAAELRRKT